MSEDLKEEYIKNFNEILINFIKFIANILPKSSIGIYQSDILRIINNRNYRKIFINKFVLNILQYKKAIDDEDEKFFLDSNFHKSVSKNKDLNENQINEKMIMDKIFEFKSHWMELNSDSKKLVFEYFKVLCNLAQKYFILCDSN